MKLLLDMNVSPIWVALFNEAGHQALHWSDVGKIAEGDENIAAWARSNDHVIISNDLDFGKILASTGDTSPSVIQLRLGRNDPLKMIGLVVLAISNSVTELEDGAILTVDHKSRRLRILPIASLMKRK
jgi:predicted nuclease of predicted toxin-antitoxin system